MKVWELISKLNTLPAGAEINIGIGPTLNASASEIAVDDMDDMNVAIRSGDDVEVCTDSGDTKFLSELCEE